MMCEHEHEWDNEYTENPNCLICKVCKMCYCQAHEIELEQQLSAAEAAEAQLTEARATIDTHSELAEHYKRMSEQAEAQAAAMRELYDHIMDHSTFKMTHHFSCPAADENPKNKHLCDCGLTKFWKIMQGINDDAGSALLAENKRMREALKRYAAGYVDCGEEAKAALEKK